MSDSPLKIAIIGLGDMGCGHARGFDHLDDCQVVATVDPEPKRMQRHDLSWKNDSPKHFHAYREMLDEIKPDACVITVPDFLHREVSEVMLDAGCDLLLEKPIATNLVDADAIIAKAEKVGSVLQIGLTYRYSNLYQKMAELGSDPDHPVQLMWCKELRQCFPQLPWFYSQESTGGTIVEKDCHHFDIFNWVIGSKPSTIYATGGQHVWKSGSEIDCSYCPDPPRKIDSIDTIDHAIISITYENGARASLILCMYLQPYNIMPEGLEIGGITTSGRQICAYQDERLGVGGLGDPFTFLDLDMKSDNEGFGHIGCQEQRRDFLRCLRDRTRKPIANGQVGRESLQVALAAERSIREGRPINVSELEACSV